MGLGGRARLTVPGPPPEMGLNQETNSQRPTHTTTQPSPDLHGCGQAGLPSWEVASSSSDSPPPQVRETVSCPVGRTLVSSTSDGISDSAGHAGKTEGAQQLQGWDDTLGHLLSRDWAGAASWIPGQSDPSNGATPLRPCG